jgi:hypothetical protein
MKKLHPKVLESIATKLTGIPAEIKLNEKLRADINIHKNKTKENHKLSKSRKEG